MHTGESSPAITKVPFARGFVVINDLAEAKKILSTEDDYVRGLSVFDLQAKTQVDDREVNVAQFMSHQAAQVLPFAEADVQKLEAMIKSVSAKLEAYPLLPSLVPEIVHLNMTTGLEEGTAAYCRGLNGIFLPQNMIQWTPSWGSLPMHELFTHELWHIISRNLEKSLRDSVYACIGFRPFNAPFQYPAPMANRKISNPDGPKFEHYIRFTTDDSGGELTALPMIYSRHPVYSKKIAPVFFRYLTVQMMAVRQNDDGVWVPAQNPKKEPGTEKTFDDLYLLDIDSLPESFWSQIGRNTAYFYHPDETTADNFVILIHKDTKTATTPAIVQKLAAVFGGDF